MLFDLRGRRRRAVQAIYLTLAVLLGGGLVLFGIGGEVSGGLVDAFRDGGGGDADSSVEDRIERQEERLARRPDDPALLQSLLRDHYQLAVSQQDPATGAFTEEATDDLRAAGRYWQRYVETVDDGDPRADSARYALQIYDVGALNQPAEAQEAAAIIARAREDSASYLQLVAYAALAGDTRTADLAAQRAIDLAPRDQRREVRQQAEALKQPPPGQEQGG